MVVGEVGNEHYHQDDVDGLAYRLGQGPECLGVSLLDSLQDDVTHELKEPQRV